MKKLSEIIAEFEQQGLIKDFYVHRDYVHGYPELNIEFDNGKWIKVSKQLEEHGVKEVDRCCFWE